MADWYPYDRFTPGDGDGSLYDDDESVAWPSEQQLTDWNIHNDHADGIEDFDVE